MLIGNYPLHCSQRSSCIQLLVIKYKEYHKVASIIDVSVSNVYQTSVQIQVITTLFAHVYCSATDISNNNNIYYNRNITLLTDNNNSTLVTIKGLESMESYQIQCSIEDNSNNLQSLVSLSSVIRTSCCKLFNVIPNMNNIITPNNYTNAIKFTFDRYPSSGVTISVVLVSINGTIYDDNIIPNTIHVGYDTKSIQKSLDYSVNLFSSGLGIIIIIIIISLSSTLLSSLLLLSSL